jgi:hypothetical protein
MELNQMAATNSVQVQLELKQPVSGDELGLMIAIGQNTKIKNSSLQEIKEVLRLVMIKIGLRSQNWPTEEEKLVLIQHIIAEFPGHTCQEIKLAFDMAIGGKLEGINNQGEPVTVSANCYENFSCLYFSGIMEAYRKWAKQVYKYLPKQVDQKELPPPVEAPMSDDDFLLLNKNIFISTANFQFISTRCFDILLAQEKIKKPEGDERNRIISMATAFFFRPENKESFGMSVELQERFILLDCKRICVCEYFNLQP